MPPQPIGTAERRFRLFLQSRGLRVTPERIQILHAVLDTEEHLQAEELAYRLQKNGSRVSRATVYRTLIHLVEAGLVRKVDFGEGHAHYENAGKGEGHHDHLICDTCGKVIEFFDPGLEQLQEEIAGRFDFHLTGHQFQLFGVCADCRNNATTENLA